ncbi:hypothetical protein ZWY2020_014095 [Hordeum vulgare]|nr:hypothetical protein ZWY2020_014095 [Hordeum vulgare]
MDMDSPPRYPGQPSGCAVTTASPSSTAVSSTAMPGNGRRRSGTSAGRAKTGASSCLDLDEGDQPWGAGDSPERDDGRVRELFSLPPGKQEHLDAGPMDPVRVGTGFSSAVDGARYWRDYVKMFAHPELHCRQTRKPAWRGRGYAACTRGLLLELTAAISEPGARGRPRAQRLDLASGLQILVGNHYPPCGGGPGDDGAVGLPAHSDHGLLTLLFQNGVDGLQVKHDGRWLLAKPIPGSFFVIAGDQLEIVSNGRYKGVLHRALVDREQVRMSCVTLIGPCLDAVVEPVPELAAPLLGLGSGVKYRDYMEHQQNLKLNEGALDLVRVATADTYSPAHIFFN